MCLLMGTIHKKCSQLAKYIMIVVVGLWALPPWILVSALMAGWLGGSIALSGHLVQWLDLWGMRSSPVPVHQKSTHGSVPNHYYRATTTNLYQSAPPTSLFLSTPVHTYDYCPPLHQPGPCRSFSPLQVIVAKTRLVHL